jgi:hypothetical protein
MPVAEPVTKATLRCVSISHAGGRKLKAFPGNLLGELGRQLPMHFREVHTGFLKDAAVRQDTRTSFPAARTLPLVFMKRSLTVDAFQGGTDPLLQILEIGGHPGLLSIVPHHFRSLPSTGKTNDDREGLLGFDYVIQRRVLSKLALR